MHISVDMNIKYVNIDPVHDDHVCSSFDSSFLYVVLQTLFIYLMNFTNKCNVDILQYLALLPFCIFGWLKIPSCTAYLVGFTFFNPNIQSWLLLQTLLEMFSNAAVFP